MQGWQLVSGRGRWESVQSGCQASILTPGSEELSGGPEAGTQGAGQGGGPRPGVRVSGASPQWEPAPLFGLQLPGGSTLPPALAGPQPFYRGESSEHRVWAIHQQLLKGNLHL